VEILIESGYAGMGHYQATEFATDIFRRAKAHSLHTRSMTISTERLEKQGEKLLKSSRGDADLFARLIYTVRINKYRHRGIDPIKPASKDWGVIKEVTAHALDFSNQFILTRKYGFTKYIEIGISKMKRFNIHKFSNMREGIYETYQAMKDIESDDDREMTKSIYSTFQRHIIEHTGIHDNLEELPEKYVWFVRARQEAKKLNVGVEIYMKAQVAAFDMTRGIPHPSQLTGPKAIERVYRYMFKHGIKV
jgi:hypothetical protein